MIATLGSFIKHQLHSISLTRIDPMTSAVLRQHQLPAAPVIIVLRYNLSLVLSSVTIFLYLRQDQERPLFQKILSIARILLSDVRRVAEHHFRLELPSHCSSEISDRRSCYLVKQERGVNIIHSQESHSFSYFHSFYFIS